MLSMNCSSICRSYEAHMDSYRPTRDTAGTKGVQPEKCDWDFRTYGRANKERGWNLLERQGAKSVCSQ